MRQAFVRCAFKRYATFEGHEATEVSNGMEGGKPMQVQHFDIIIMDIMMPELDGFPQPLKRSEKSLPIPCSHASLPKGRVFDKVFGP